MEQQGEVLIASDVNAGSRLDVFIAERMPPHISRSRVQAIIREGGVTVDGQTCTEPKRKLRGGEHIALEIPDAEESKIEPEPIDLDIIHEDEHLIVINKPAGMVVHPAIGNWSGTLVNALLHHCKGSLSGIGGIRRPGIVHRLDKDTSGLLVAAKDDKAHLGLAAQFADHGRTGSLERAYLALAWGKLAQVSGTIDAALGRSTANRRKRAVMSPGNQEAKHAITHYSVLETFGPDDKGGAIASKVECRLETGRTHQIRVHFSHLGHPLIGDQDYGKHFQTKENLLPDNVRQSINRFKRQALHAHLLGFEHPVTQAHLRFEIEPPEDFQVLEAALRNCN